MGRIPKKVECMIGQANLRSPGKRSAPGDFCWAWDSRVRALRLPVYGPALDCNTDEVDCGKLAASVYPASYLGVSSRALMEIRSTHRAHRAIGLQAAFG